MQKRIQVLKLSIIFNRSPKVAYMQLRIITAVLLLAASPDAAIAQQSSGSNITVRGSIGAATLIAPADSEFLNVEDNVSAHLIAIDKINVIVRLSGSFASKNSRVRVRLLLRTNTAFELRASASDTGAAPAISAKTGSIHSTGAGVLPAAVSGVQRVSSAVELSAEPSVLARGPRISRGSAASPRNAIEIELVFEVGANSLDVWSKDLLVTIAPGAGL